MRRSALVIVAAAAAGGIVAACAPSTTSGAVFTPAPVVSQVSSTTNNATSFEGTATLGDAPRSVKASLDQPPTAVWTAVKRAYLAMKIPVTVENPAAHQIGNAQFYDTRRLADSLMSTWLDCGSGPEGLRANNDRVYMSLLTMVTPNGKGGTNLETSFSAYSIDVSAGASAQQACSSKGTLEPYLIDLVKANTVK